jgi:flagellar hook-associated protein 1 FlgK
LVVAIDGNPVAGDSFAVDSNSEGIGDNANMLRIAALQDKPILADGRTFSEAYIALVNTVGSKAALSMMSKDQVSGVSLDEEAANLIRFQQAYQASAQIIQVASKLFDSILSIR